LRSTLHFLAIVLSALVFAGFGNVMFSASTVPSLSEKSGASFTVSQQLMSDAKEALWTALKEERAGWSRIHAAEALAQFGESENVRAHFQRGLSGWENSAQRIGAWRVLAATSQEQPQRAPWMAKIEAIARDSGAPDRLQAIETLAKLGHRASPELISILQSTLPQWAEHDRLFVDWGLHLAGVADATRRLTFAPRSSNVEVRRRAAYIARRLDPLPDAMREAIEEQVRHERTDTIAFPYSLAACLVHGMSHLSRADAKSTLLGIWRSASAAVRLEISHPLAALLSPPDLESFRNDLEAGDIPGRVAAASLILKTGATPR
jgi:hypothetical protein